MDDGLSPQCRECYSKERKAYGRVRNRKEHLSKYFKLKWDRYLQMFADQGGACAICRKPVKETSTAEDQDSVARVDHCHTTGKVRGLLCRGCNHGLGMFRDDTNLLAEAIRYLEKARIDKEN